MYGAVTMAATKRTCCSRKRRHKQLSRVAQPGKFASDSNGVGDDGEDFDNMEPFGAKCWRDVCSDGNCREMGNDTCASTLAVMDIAVADWWRTSKVVACHRPASHGAGARQHFLFARHYRHRQRLQRALVVLLSAFALVGASEQVGKRCRSFRRSRAAAEVLQAVRNEWTAGRIYRCEKGASGFPTKRFITAAGWCVAMTCNDIAAPGLVHFRWRRRRSRSVGLTAVATLVLTGGLGLIRWDKIGRAGQTLFGVALGGCLGVFAAGA